MWNRYGAGGHLVILRGVLETNVCSPLNRYDSRRGYSNIAVLESLQGPAAAQLLRVPYRPAELAGLEAAAHVLGADRAGQDRGGALGLVRRPVPVEAAALEVGGVAAPVLGEVPRVLERIAERAVSAAGPLPVLLHLAVHLEGPVRGGNQDAHYRPRSLGQYLPRFE